MDGKIPKDQYTITKEGERFLIEWLKKPFKGNQIVRYGLELKILFLHNLGKDDRNNFIKAQIQEIERTIDDLPVWKRTFKINNFYRDKLYEEKLREFKNYITLLESFLS